MTQFNLLSLIADAIGTFVGRLGTTVNRTFGGSRHPDPMSANTKAELARRLNVAEQDLISREEAAKILGLGANTLRTHTDEHVGFYRLSDAQSARALYPKPWVEEYKRWREAGRQTSFPNEKCGLRPWPDAPAPRRITLRTYLLIIDRWQYRELHHRCEAVCGGQASFSDLIKIHRAEWKILFDKEGSRRSPNEPEVAAALLEKVRELAIPDGAEPEPKKYLTLMKSAWERVLEAERGWLMEMPR